MGISEEEYIVVGRVVKPVGSKGEVKVYPETDSIQRFEKLEYIFINKSNLFEKIEVENTRIIGKNIGIKFTGIDDIQSAYELVGKYLYVEKKNAVKLPEGSYYYYDLTRCEVKSIGGKVLGKMQNIINVGEYDVYIVNMYETGEEVYIPAIREIVKRIDILKREIIIDPIEGLLDSKT